MDLRPFGKDSMTSAPTNGRFQPNGYHATSETDNDPKRPLRQGLYRAGRGAQCRPFFSLCRLCPQPILLSSNNAADVGGAIPPPYPVWGRERPVTTVAQSRSVANPDSSQPAPTAPRPKIAADGRFCPNGYQHTAKSPQRPETAVLSRF
jgi:hypothetical protein